MVLATTLTDHEKYDCQDLAAIYAQRWAIKLRLRDVKTTLEMQHLRVKTPENARKTLQMALIAYNLIKSSCEETAHPVGRDLRLISFKGALDTIVANSARCGMASGGCRGPFGASWRRGGLHLCWRVRGWVVTSSSRRLWTAEACSARYPQFSTRDWYETIVDFSLAEWSSKSALNHQALRGRPMSSPL
jgi:hypothetical protein